MIKAYSRLFRLPNLLVLIAVQCIIKYALLAPFGVPQTLSTMQFLGLVCATLGLAAAGYVFNDIQDVQTDVINKPNSRVVGRSLSEKTAYRWFFGLNVFGVLLGFAVAQSIDRPSFAIIFLLISVLLYVYSSMLKGIPIIGNVTVALLSASSLLVVLIFDVLPSTSTGNILVTKSVTRLILDYTLFAFLTTWIREHVKDMEDLDGDRNAGWRTLPVRIGLEPSRWLTLVFNALLIAGVAYYTFDKLYAWSVMAFYFTFVIIGLMLVALVKTIGAKTASEFKSIALIWKLTMVAGVLSIILYPYVLL